MNTWTDITANIYEYTGRDYNKDIETHGQIKLQRYTNTQIEIDSKICKMWADRTTKRYKYTNRDNNEDI